MCNYFLEFHIHLHLHNVTLCNATPSLISCNPRNICARFKHPSLLSRFPLIYIMFLTLIIHQRSKTTRSYTSCCHHCHYKHYCNVGSVLFHDVTLYTNSLLSCIHVNTTNILNIMCTLVAIGMILGRLDCIVNLNSLSYWTQIQIKRNYICIIIDPLEYLYPS